MHNVEKSKFQKDLYVGYGGGAVWHIRNYGKGNWRATPQGNNKHQVFSCATLRDVSTQLETLNTKRGAESDYETFAASVKKNPAKRPVPKKRAISRPSQVTKKAPSKRLVTRRKIAAKKPVKGYFPNPSSTTIKMLIQSSVDGSTWETIEIIEGPVSVARALKNHATYNAKWFAKKYPEKYFRVIKK